MAGYTTNDNGICAVKSEATYGTDAFGGAAPADSDCLAVAEVMIKGVQEAVLGGRITATVASECHGIHKSHSEVSITTPLIGASAAGELPPCDALLKACGFAATVDAGVDVTYVPDIKQQAALTAAFYQRNVNDGNARRIFARGVRGNMTLTMAIGQEAQLEFTGQGLYQDRATADSAFPTLPAEYSEDQCAWIVNNLSISVGGTTYPCEEVSLETPWNIEVIRTGDSSGGGTASAVLLMMPKEGARFGGGLTLADGATALAAAIGLVQTGAKVAFSATLTKGSRTISIEADAIQLGVDLDDQSPKYALTWHAVRADGADGADHLKIIFA